MSYADDIKEKISQFDQETARLLRELIRNQSREIDFFERNWLYKYEDLYKYLSDEAIMAVRDVDERNELQLQKSKIENSFKNQLNSLKRKQKKEYDSFTQKRLKDRALIFSSDKNATIVSYRVNSPLPSPIKMTKINQLINNSDQPDQERTIKVKRKKRVRKTKINPQIDNNFDNNSFTDDDGNQNLLDKGQININQHSLNKNQTSNSNTHQPTKKLRKGSSSLFLSSRFRFIPKSSQKCPFAVKALSKIQHKNDKEEELNVLDIESLDKHFKRRDQKRKEIEKERQSRFEEKFSYQINSKDVLNYRRKNITDRKIIDKIQNKYKGELSTFKIAEVEEDDPSKIESSSEIIELNSKNKIPIEPLKIEEEEIKIAPVNILDSIHPDSESSSDSVEKKIPTNQISLDYSYESYYSEYEVEEKIYLRPIKKIKKKEKSEK